MRIISILYVTFLLLPLSAISQADISSHYKIYNTVTQKPATIDDIISSMDRNDVLFFGEEHNDSTGHQLEALLLQKLFERYHSKTALSMEMFETDCQTVLNEYLRGLIREKNFRRMQGCGRTIKITAR